MICSKIDKELSKIHFLKKGRTKYGGHYFKVNPKFLTKLNN